MYLCSVTDHIPAWFVCWAAILCAAQCGVYITVTFVHNIVVNNINEFNNSVNVLYYDIIICLQSEINTLTQYLGVLRLILCLV